jgi:hypothetical protein
MGRESQMLETSNAITFYTLFFFFINNRNIIKSIKRYQVQREYTRKAT